MVNSFEYRLVIDDDPYTIVVATEGDRKRIVVNTKVVYDAVCASWMRPKTDIMYFPFYIKNKYIVVSIDDRELNFKYNIYVDNVSPIDESDLYDDYKKAKEIIDGGIWRFIKTNWVRMLVTLLILSIVEFPLMQLLFYQKTVTLESRVLVTVIAVALMPLLIFGEWWFNLRTVKKFKNRFRISNIVRI